MARWSVDRFSKTLQFRAHFDRHIHSLLSSMQTNEFHFLYTTAAVPRLCHVLTGNMWISNWSYELWYIAKTGSGNMRMVKSKKAGMLGKRWIICWQIFQLNFNSKMCACSEHRVGFEFGHWARSFMLFVARDTQKYFKTIYQIGSVCVMINGNQFFESWCSQMCVFYNTRLKTSVCVILLIKLFLGFNFEYLNVKSPTELIVSSSDHAFWCSS